MKEKTLYYLHELDNYKVAADDPDIRGWQLVDEENNNVGTVDNLVVNKEVERVVYLDIKIAESISLRGEHSYVEADTDSATGNKADHILIPTDMVRLDRENKSVISYEIDYDTLCSVRRFAANTVIDPDYEDEINRVYGDRPKKHSCNGIRLPGHRHFSKR